MSSEERCMFCGTWGFDHEHYSVVVRKGGKLLGRLTPDGYTTTRRIHAAMYAKERAEKIAQEINTNAQGLSADATAKVVKF